MLPGVALIQGRRAVHRARLRESGERANAYFEQANYQLGQLNQGVATSNFMQYLDLYGMVKK